MSVGGIGPAGLSSGESRLRIPSSGSQRRFQGGQSFIYRVTKLAKGAVMSLGPFSNSPLFTGMKLPRHYKRGFHTFVHETPVSSTM